MNLAIRNQAGQVVATISQGRVSLISETVRQEEAPAIILATIGWSGALKLAKKRLSDLTFQTCRHLDILKDEDFVSAYQAARTRTPELSPRQARNLVVPYWLLHAGPHTKPTPKQEQYVKRSLRPRLLTKREDLHREDFVALAHLGVAYHSHSNEPVSLLL